MSRAPLTPEQRRMVAEYVPMAKSRAARWVRLYNRTGFTLADDIHQAAQMGLVYAAGGYEPERNVAFGLYAKQWVDQAIRVEISKMRGPVASPQHDKKVPLYRVDPATGGGFSSEEHVSEDERWGFLLHHTPEPDAPLDAQRLARRLRPLLIEERTGELRRKCFAKNVPSQADMFVRWLQGEPGQDIAAEYGMHRSAFDQVLNRLYPAYARVAHRIRNEAA